MLKLTKSVEDYLETIYRISPEQNVVRVKEIANLLSISLPSVTSSIKKLRKAGLVENEKYGYISLTEEGKVLAKDVYERHKILYHFLTDILNVSNKIAVEVACRMEHCLSKETAQKLKKFVNNKLTKNKRRD